jgi:hypothetical protein
LVQQLEGMARDLAVLRRSLKELAARQEHLVDAQDQLAARQEQMAQKIAKPQAVEQDIIQERSSPSLSGPVSPPPRKKARRVEPRKLAAQSSSVPPPPKAATGTSSEYALTSNTPQWWHHRAAGDRQGAHAIRAHVAESHATRLSGYSLKIHPDPLYFPPWMEAPPLD